MTDWFFYDKQGKKQGPFTDSQLRFLVKTRRITAETRMETGDGRKGLAGEIRGLFPSRDEALIPGSSPPSPPPVSSRQTDTASPVHKNTPSDTDNSNGLGPQTQSDAPHQPQNGSDMVQKTKFCYQCGKSISPGEVTCPQCGAPVYIPDDGSSKAMTPQMEETNENLGGSLNKGCFVAIVAAAVLFVGAILAVTVGVIVTSNRAAKVASSICNGANDGEYFTFRGKQLRMSEEIFGIRLGEDISKYKTGKWAQEYRIEREQDPEFRTYEVRLDPLKKGPIESIYISVDAVTNRIEHFSVFLGGNSTRNQTIIEKRLSSLYKADRIDTKGHKWFKSKEEPSISICVGPNGSSLHIFCTHNDMI
ncbi:MAG: hypothetical protein IKE64_10970 [Thermoguttaceae bacterium]|nr:hypothetical protein [Thermoguttaceae bacterium]